MGETVRQTIKRVMTGTDNIGRPMHKTVHGGPDPHALSRQESDRRHEHVSMAVAAGSAQTHPANSFSNAADMAGGQNLIRRADMEGWSKQVMRERIPNSMSRDPEMAKRPDTVRQSLYRAMETERVKARTGEVDPNATHRQWMGNAIVAAAPYSQTDRSRMAQVIEAHVRGGLTPREYQTLSRDSSPAAILKIARDRGI